MKFLNIIRSSEWWDYKIPPLLALAFATSIRYDVPLLRAGIWFIFLILCIALGGMFVSVVNDITDLEEDIACGKHNRIASVPEKLRWAIPIACLLIGLLFIWILYPDLISILLFIMPCVAFSAYSLEPIRLKRRGILGVLADASGSHVFPSLFFIASTSHYLGQPIDLAWFVSIGLWSLMYGMRGILWHQFFDRENDAKINLNTYAAKVSPVSFKQKEKIIFGFEVVLLLLILAQIPSILPFVFLFLYLILVLIRYKGLGYQVSMILTPPDKPFQLILLDYYQVFFPVSLILSSIFYHPFDLIVLICYLVLFPSSVMKVVKDSVGFVYRKLSVRYFP